KPQMTSSRRSHQLIRTDPSVTLTCKQDDSQFFYMFWYRQRGGGGRMELLVYSPGASVANVEAPFNGSKYSAFRPTVLASSLQVQAVEAADAAVYFCASSRAQSYFGKGTKLTVLGESRVTAPTRVKVLSPSEKECSSGKKTLVCVASGFYPDHVSVSWMINGGAVSKGVATDSAATRQNRTYRITSRLTVFSEEWTSNNLFVCSVSFFNGTTTTYHNGSITGEAKSEFLCSTNV
uniref:Ig-like domain-containing protein n=1 Tax=Oryzias sinensis TaxID=183150 RepID=A0A8C8E3V1_9TELE